MTVTSITVADLLGDSVVTATGSTTLRQAAELMDESDVGALLVENAHGTLGIVTERDIVRAIAERLDVDDERVADAMTTALEVVEPDTTVREALERMRANQIRHLVVWDGDGGDVGVVSMRRLLDVLVDATTS